MKKKHISTLTVPIFVLRIHILSSKVIIIHKIRFDEVSRVGKMFTFSWYEIIKHWT